MDYNTTNIIRFLAVADIHNSGMKDINPTGFDAMIVAGDFKFHGWSSCKEEERYRVNDDPFFAWCNAYADFPVFLIPGNHDRVVERHPDRLEWPKNVKRLDTDTVTEFKGVRLWGSPWSLEHSQGSVFSCAEEALANKFVAMPDNLDVLVLHGPPRLEDSEGDADRDCGHSEAHFGSKAIREAVLARKPRVVICGHIHQGAREPSNLAGTIVLNVGRVWHKSDEAPSLSPAVIEFGSDGKIDITPAGRIPKVAL